MSARIQSASNQLPASLCMHIKEPFCCRICGSYIKNRVFKHTYDWSWKCHFPAYCTWLCSPHCDTTASLVFQHAEVCGTSVYTCVKCAKVILQVANCVLFLNDTTVGLLESEYVFYVQCSRFIWSCLTSGVWSVQFSFKLYCACRHTYLSTFGSTRSAVQIESCGIESALIQPSHFMCYLHTDLALNLSWDSLWLKNAFDCLIALTGKDHQWPLTGSCLNF